MIIYCFTNKHIVLQITKVIILLKTQKRMNGHKDVELKEIGLRCEMRLF